MHLSEGEIRAFQDIELTNKDPRQVIIHLQECPECQRLADDLLTRKMQVQQHLSVLEGEPARQLSPEIGRSHLQARLDNLNKENTPMWKIIHNRRYRPVWISLTLVAILAISFAFAPVRAIANNFLGLFRVQQVTVVQFDPARLSQLENIDQLESLISEDMRFEQDGEITQVSDAAQASSLAGFSVRLPADMVGTLELEVLPGGSIEFEVDRERIQALLVAIESPDLQIPTSLDGANISVKVPRGIQAMYGCNYDAGVAHQEGFDPDQPNSWPKTECVNLLQMPSPEVNAPPDLDLSQLGQVYLQLLGMTEKQAARFAADVDWTTTFVIPIPRGQANYKQVNVDSVTGVLLTESSGNDAPYILIWIKDGIVNALSGQGGSATALKIANSLR